MPRRVRPASSRAIRQSAPAEGRALRVADLLAADRIVLMTEPGGRDAVLDAAARLLSGNSPALTSAISGILRVREDEGGTAIGHGIAVPHARCRASDEARGAFLRLGRPVDFGAGDHRHRVDLVFALAIPDHSPQLHLQALAAIAGRFSDPEFVDAVRGARDLPALRRVLLGLPHPTMAMNG